MTTFRRIVTSLALAGMTFAPAIAGAQTVSANTDNTATVVVVEQRKEWEAKKDEKRSTIAKVQLVINAYRKSAHQADAQYKKSAGEARNKLMHALKEAIKAKDRDAAYRAFEAYFKSEDEAEAKRDATRIEARSKLMLELKVILG
ncbi:MAG: hypothetical protein AAB579_02175 [Patescibacteria group bacterium]